MLPTKELISDKAAGSHTAHLQPVIDFLEAQSSEPATDAAFYYTRDGLGVSHGVVVGNLFQVQGREEVVAEVPNWSGHCKLNADQLAAAVKQVTKADFQLAKGF